VTEVRVFSNAFIRCLAENINSCAPELKHFLCGIVEEYPDESFIAPNSKDWDAQNLKQRCVPYAKRLQLLYRVKIFIQKFK